MTLILMQRGILTLLGVALSIIVSAQELSLLRTLKTEEESLQKSLTEISYPTRKVKDHFFYLNKTWQRSIIITTGGKKLFFNGRYNLLNKSIEYKIRGVIRTIHINKITLVKIGDIILIPVAKATDPDVKSHQYLEVLSFGEINLLKAYKLGRMAGSQGQSLIPTGSESHVYEHLFFTYDFKDIFALEKSKKKILKLLTSKQENLQKYAKNEKLKFGLDEDLIKIFDYYNSRLN